MPDRQSLRSAGALSLRAAGRSEGPRRLPTAAVIGIGVTALTGCSFGTVDVDPFTPEAGTEQLCADLYASLPDVLDDAVRRELSPPTTTASAWGAPPIVMRCGVAEPSRDPQVALLVVDGVSWYPEKGDGGDFFTVVDRAVFVEVAIPDDYEPAGDVLVDLGPAISEGIPLSTDAGR